MKFLATLLACAACGTLQAQITTGTDWRQAARVLGTTAQQAILAYSTPVMQEGEACTIEVSPSNTYLPLVPDVNGVLFPGANLDSRPGSYIEGRVRTVTIGKRTVETASDGNNYSRSLGAATTYYYRITCPSQGGVSTATGAFATGVIPSGLGYGDPIPVDPDHPGNYLYPTLSTTDRSASTVDPHTGAQVKNMTLPGDVTGGTAPSMGTAGTAQYCHPTPVQASDENTYGYHCLVVIQGSSGAGLYWVAPDGEARFLGVANTNYGGNYLDSNWAMGSQGPLFDVSTPTPNTFYWMVTGPGSNASPPWSRSRHYVLKGVYTGHTSKGQDADLSNQPVAALSGMPHTKFSAVTPSDSNFDRSIETLMSEFDPNWVTYGLVCCAGYLNEDFVNGQLEMHWWNSQDNFGWIAVLDLNATAATQAAKFGTSAGCIDNPAVTGKSYQGMGGCVVASMGSFTGSGGSPYRYSVLHNEASGVNLGSGMERIAVNSLRQTMGAAYSVSLPNGMPAGGFPCTMANPGTASNIRDWPTASWGPGCSTISVSGDPTLTATITGYPHAWPAAPGDLVSIRSDNPAAHELARLLDKGSDGNMWYIQRQYSPQGLRSYDAVAPNGTLDMVSSGYGLGTWWDYTNGPRGTDSTNTYLDATVGGGHTAFEYHATYGRWTVGDTAIGSNWLGINAQQGLESARFNQAAYPVFQLALPGFNGVACAGNSSTPCAVESHPSLSLLNAPDAATYAQVINNHPYTGDYGLVGASNVTQVGNQLYRIRGTNVLSNYKKIAYFANSGNRAMREVSGPNVQLAADASTQFQWCVAYNPGECYNGSLPGDIYFNAPNVANASCANNWNTLLNTTAVPNDICVSPSWDWTQAITMQRLENDPNGAAHRTISNSFGRYESQSNFWNSRAIPDGSWLFTNVMDGSIKLIKVPPMVQDAVKRAAYVPVIVTLPASAGADGAVVEFGYAEQGEGKFYCTARQESCEANAAAINPANPFYFTGEAYTPAPCSAGCSIAIPSISGRIVEYRLKMFSGNTVMYTSPMMLAAVP